MAQSNVTAAGRILIAEDDEMLALFLQRLLHSEGYEAECVADGPAVLRRIDAEPRFLLLDLNLPGADGIHILQSLRSEHPDLPIMVLTARKREDGLLLAFQNGADDCLLKPFSYIELLCRIRALRRRAVSAPISRIQRCGDLSLDRESITVKRGERRIDLTQREFTLLECLMRTPEAPVARTRLLKEVWGEACDSSTNIVDVYMKYVRDKVDLPGLPKFIHTIRGVGYMISSASAS